MIRAAQLNLILLAAISGIARFAEAEAVAPDATAAQNLSQPQTISVPLEYREVEFSMGNVAVSLDGPKGDRSGLIEKAPETKGAKPVYGALQLGKERMELAWDKAQRKLYLDLNRNQDLTDDPGGVFSASAKGSYQTFRNIHLSATDEGGEWRFLVDLNLHEFGRSRLNGYASLRSFYAGKVELAGRSWQVGLVKRSVDRVGADESVTLLFRPWEDCTQSFSLYDRSADTFALRKKLFLQNQAYSTRTSFEGEGESSKPRLELVPQQTPLGELRVSGEGVHRLVLESRGDYTAIFDAPSGVLRVPLGTYNRTQVRLQKGDNEAFGDFDAAVTVSDKTVATLPVGGPLTNSVTVSRAGRWLQLSYKLIGISGRPYELVDRGERKAPEFAIYKGDRRLATGKFQFG